MSGQDWTKTVSQERGITISPSTRSFGPDAGASGKKPPPTEEELAAARARGEEEGPLMDGWLAGLFPEEDHDVSMDDLSDADREAIANLPEGGTLHLTFENTEWDGVGAEDEQERLAEIDDVTSVHNASPAVIRYLMQSDKFENLILNGHADEHGIYITGEDGLPQLLPAGDLAAMAEGTAIGEALIEGCESGEGLSLAFAEAGIDNVGYGNAVTNGQGLNDAEAFASSGSLDAIQTDQDIYDQMAAGTGYDSARFAYMRQEASADSDIYEGVEGPSEAQQERDRARGPGGHIM